MHNAQCTFQMRSASCHPLASWSSVSLLASPGAAQDVRLLSTKVADILAQFPAGAPADRDKLADQILGLGEPGLAAIAKQLVPAGGRHRHRRPLRAERGRRVREQGARAEAALAERSFADAVGAAADVEVRTFLLSQLRSSGGTRRSRRPRRCSPTRRWSSPRRS